ncbi:MAG: SOS response-associated peptidase [Gemmataceae bacterium]|nr:SOS response-associated peptidase [Gemmataceae bacterium]
MCGRFTQTASREALRTLFPLFEIPELEPRYNVAPSQPVLAVFVPPGQEQPAAAFLHWGLVPHWANPPRSVKHPINARAETAASQPTFRVPFRKRRCLVVADGFYEWQKVGKHKQPHYFRLSDGRPFAFAGLWDRWEGEGEVIDSCALLTTAANELVQPVHERMPVVLAPGDFGLWLDPRAQPPELEALLRPYPAEEMTAYPVGSAVNNGRHDAPDCVAPLAG